MISPGEAEATLKGANSSPASNEWPGYVDILGMDNSFTKNRAPPGRACRNDGMNDEASAEGTSDALGACLKGS
jgi:hypothetical protein